MSDEHKPDMPVEVLAMAREISDLCQGHELGDALLALLMNLDFLLKYYFEDEPECPPDLRRLGTEFRARASQVKEALAEAVAEKRGRLEKPTRVQ